MLVCLFLLELVMRQIYPEYDPRGNVIFHMNKDGVVLAEPGFSGRQWRSSGEFNVKVDINEYGFRDKNDLKNTTSKDFILLGDSYSFGHGVEEDKRYGNLIQDLFSDSIKVYNAAISSSHFLNYQKNLEYAKGKGADSKNLLLGVCMENDILDYDEILANPRDYEEGFSFKNWLNQKSCLYNFIAIQMQSNEKLRSVLIKIGVVRDGITSYEFKGSSEQELNTSLEQLKKLIAGYESLVILIPSRMNWIEGKEVIASESHEKFKSLLESNDIPFLDMKTFIEMHGEGRPLETLHFEKDGHWNNNGHQVAADMIFREWQKLKSSKVSLETLED